MSSSRRFSGRGLVSVKSKPAPVPSNRSLRQRLSITTYAISSDSDDDSDIPATQETTRYNEEPSSESESEEQEEEEQTEALKPERSSAGGRSLRHRNSLRAPEGLSDYVSTDVALGNKKRKKKNKKNKKKVVVKVQGGRACVACRESRKKCDRKKPACSGCVTAGKACVVPSGGEDGANGEDDGWEDYEETEELTVRGEIRKSLEATKTRRNAFFLHYRELFESLLPEHNYVSKLAVKIEVSKMSQTSTTPTEVKEEEDKPEIQAEDKMDIDGQANQTVDDSEKQLAVEKQSVIQQSESKPVEPIVLPKVVPYSLLEKQPENVKATMKPYQLSGLSFLVWLYNNGTNGILGDEMGLGKTLQTLSLFSYLTTYRPCPKTHRRPFLVVCPLSVVSSWMSECRRWTPHLRALRFHGPASERNRLKKAAETGESIGLDDAVADGDDRGYDAIITSYEVFEREKAWFRRAFVWRYVVCDEGHKLKNIDTNISRALQGLSAEFRLLLTGTPLQNNLTELWALLHWLCPEVYQENTSKLFADAFDLSKGKNNLNVMDDARRLLELIMLRRMKESKGVNLGLPKKTEVIMYLPLVPMQRFWYKRLLTKLDKGLLDGVFRGSKAKAEEDDADGVPVDDKELEEAAELAGDQWGATRAIVERAVQDSRTDGKWRKLMNLLMQLRKCCNHPFLLPNAEPENGTCSDLSSLILGSAKFMFLDKLVEELCLKQGKKVLIFSGFTKMLDLCEDFLLLKGGDGTRFKHGRLDGTTPRARRNLAIRLFNADPDYKVMLISTRAGGLGINLASASDVVMLESDWNPQADLQAQARAHRIGQTNPVTVYRLITQGTVEEQMMGRIRKKLYLSAKVTETMRDIHTATSSIGLSGDTEDSQPTLSTGQLMSLVRSGSRAIARPEIDPAEIIKWDWETTIQKCRDYQEHLKAEESADPSEEEQKWLSEMEKVESRVFEGKNHAKATDSTKMIAQEWDREARRVGMNRVVMIDGHPVLKETVGNNEWEAVKTLAGTDPRLAEPPKRKRKQLFHQDYCQVCYDGGQVYTCSGCPRVYHLGCLPPKFKPLLRAKIGNFFCPQHECMECEQKTMNAGGLIFRCRWCENGYCEDCLDWDATELVGDSIPEMELIGFGAVEQAFWIKCHNCKERHEMDPDARQMCEEMLAEWEEKMTGLTDMGTTVEGSEVATPRSEDSLSVTVEKAGKKKRKRSETITEKGKKKIVRVQVVSD